MLLYVRMAVVMLVSLYTSRVVLNVLGVVDFGVYNVVSGIVVLFSFLNTALANSSQRFLSISIAGGSRTAVESTFSVCLFLHMALAALILLLCETAGLYYVRHYLSVPQGKETLAIFAFHLAAAATCMNVLRVPFYAVLISYENMSAVAYLSIAEALLKLCGVLLLPHVPGEKLQAYSVMLLVVYLLVLLSFMAVSIFRYRLRLRRVRDWKLFREFTGFSGWNMLAGAADITYQQGTNLVINYFCGVTVNAAVGIMNQVRTAVYSFVYNLQLAANPQIIKSYSSGETAYFHYLISLVSRTGYVLMLVLGIPLILNMSYILDLWLVSVPAYTVRFCILILIFCLIDSLTGPLWVSMQATGKIALYTAVTGTIVLLNLPLSYLALRSGFQPSSVYMIQIGLCVLSLTAKLIFVKFYTGFSIRTYLSEVMAPLVAVTAIAFSISSFSVMNLSGLPRLLVSGLVGFLSVSVSMFYIGLKNEEREKLITKIRSLLRRKRK